ncbi:MAG: M28 family peptidase [Planctomycetes bacterium]|nr:M28 family peptidase [Planctomycetota bacterium]
MLDWIRQIVALGVRRPGSPGDLAAEGFLEQKFQEFGLTEVHREPVPVQYWASTETSLVVPADGDRSIPCFAVPYTAWTDSEGMTAPTVFLQEGTQDNFEAVDVRGKLVVLDVRFGDFSADLLKSASHFVHDPAETIPAGVLHTATWLVENFAAYFEAERRGALGVIGILRDSPIDGPQQYVPYDGHLKKLPAVWVGRESGDSLRELARRGETLTLQSLGTTEEVQSHNVVATVPGSGDESIVLTCHHDGPFASAVEDASGLAVLLWLAQHFSAREQPLRRSLVFVASSGHFHGGIGNRVFVERHREGLLRNTVAALGIEHIAEEAESDGQGGYQLTGQAELRVLFVDQGPRLLSLLEELVGRWQLDRTLAIDPYVFGPEPPCDSAPFFTAGIPSVCHISGPLYLFDPHDTVDKVRADDLPRVAGIFQELIEAIDPLPAEVLAEGLQRNRNEPLPPLPPWFCAPEDYPRPE